MDSFHQLFQSLDEVAYTQVCIDNALCMSCMCDTVHHHCNLCDLGIKTCSLINRYILAPTNGTVSFVLSISLKTHVDSSLLTYLAQLIKHCFSQFNPLIFQADQTQIFSRLE